MRAAQTMEYMQGREVRRKLSFVCVIPCQKGFYIAKSCTL